MPIEEREKKRLYLNEEALTHTHTQTHTDKETGTKATLNSARCPLWFLGLKRYCIHNTQFKQKYCNLIRSPRSAVDSALDF